MGAKASEAQGVATREELARQLCAMTPDEVTDLLLQHLQHIAQLEHQLRTLQATHSQDVQVVHLQRDGPAPWREPHD